MGMGLGALSSSPMGAGGLSSSPMGGVLSSSPMASLSSSPLGTGFCPQPVVVGMGPAQPVVVGGMGMGPFSQLGVGPGSVGLSASPTGPGTVPCWLQECGWQKPLVNSACAPLKLLLLLHSYFLFFFSLTALLFSVQKYHFVSLSVIFMRYWCETTVHVGGRGGEKNVEDRL